MDTPLIDIVSSNEPTKPDINQPNIAVNQPNIAVVNPSNNDTSPSQIKKATNWKQYILIAVFVIIVFLLIYFMFPNGEGFSGKKKKTEKNEADKLIQKINKRQEENIEKSGMDESLFILN